MCFSQRGLCSLSAMSILFFVTKPIVVRSTMIQKFLLQNVQVMKQNTKILLETTTKLDKALGEH